MKKSTAPEPAPVKESLPTQLEVKIHSLRTGGPVLANASVTLNGCFAVRGLRVVDSENGPFVSMPRYKTGSEYRDICFPCTKEFHQHFHQAVLDAYQQALAQLPQRQQERPEQPSPSMDGMTM